MKERGDWQDIPQWEVQRFDYIALSFIKEPADTALSALLANPFVSLFDRSPNFLDITMLFGLDRVGHCFTEAPLDWTNFLEPQITKGFVHFLETGRRAERNARCIAFASAAWRLVHGERPKFENLPILKVLAIPEDGRCDIIVELHTPDGVIGIVIEAKFGSSLSDHQLRSYRMHALQRPGWDPVHTLFLVLLRDRKEQDRRVLKENPDWHWGRWWDFLQLLEEETTKSNDDRCYRQFRRTVWSQAV